MRPEHTHRYVQLRQNATVEVCPCGKWRHVAPVAHPIVEHPAPHVVAFLAERRDRTPPVTK